ncbi:hypothetical protein QVD17_19970 [Tagetes erecta]|uniref:Transmembrane 9 superfamily member n=1 Tax=Tagetes erecta TaxID=13708 RepID=A0AAD8NXF7_TARER|nr:hypothetical protein QVD17_19970 [Tagetes erecta]
MNLSIVNLISKNVEKARICELELDESKVKQFKEAIENTYWFEFFIGFVGDLHTDKNSDTKRMLFTHKNITIHYNKDQINHVNLTQDNPKPLEADKTLEMTYSVWVTNLNNFVGRAITRVNDFRYMDFLNEGNENEFDAILAEMKREMNMYDMLKELGYKCTSDESLCKDLLSLLSLLTEVTVARVLGTIIQSDVGLGTVIENLHQEGFYVLDEAAFSLLSSCYKHASQVLIYFLLFQFPNSLMKKKCIESVV